MPFPRTLSIVFMYDTAPGQGKIRKEVSIARSILVKALATPGMKTRPFLISLTVVAYEVLAGVITDTSISNLEPPVGQTNVPRCSALCGTPPFDDCIKTIDFYLTSDQFDGRFCVTSAHSYGPAFPPAPSSNCEFRINPSLENIGGPVTCVSQHDLASVGKNLAKACPGGKGWGGCYVFSYGVSLCLLDLASEDSCAPLLSETG